MTEPWKEKTVTYNSRPPSGQEVGRLGPVAEQQVVECRLDLPLADRQELSLVIDPTNCDGVDYDARESGTPPELIIEYEL